MRAAWTRHDLGGSTLPRWVCTWGLAAGGFQQAVLPAGQGDIPSSWEDLGGAGVCPSQRLT